MKHLLLSMIFCYSLFASITVNILSDQGYPPYSYKENKLAKGIYPDVINLAFSNIDGYDVLITPMPWKKTLTLVKSGKVIAFFPPYFLKSRLLWLSYSKAIIQEKTIIFAKEHILKDKVNFPQDYLGLTVCFNRGYNIKSMAGEELYNLVQDKKIIAIEANDSNGCLARVNRNIADFYIADRLINKSKFPNVKKGQNVITNAGYLGFTLKVDNYPYLDDLKNKFNNEIIKLKQSGEINKIVNRYININEK